MNFPIVSSPISSSNPVVAPTQHIMSDTVTDDGNGLVLAQELDSIEPNLGISPALLEGGPSPILSPEIDISASGGLVYGAMGGASAWWTPIQAPDDGQPPVKVSSATRHSKRISTQANTIARRDDTETASVEMVAMSTRPRLRKTDEKGKLVWPFELETVLIAGLRKYHATSCRPRPSASRNFNRNKLVAEYIENMTGIKRTTKQIASRIQVLRDAWKGKKEFSLVAQPRELSEMGYLPPFEGQITGSSLDPAVTEDNNPGPTRNARRTRRSRKAVKFHDEDNGSDDYQPPEDETIRVSRKPLRLSEPTKACPVATISFDPYQLDSLGPPQAPLENLLPPSALFFVKNTLRRDKSLTSFLAKCTVPSAGSKRLDSVASDIQIVVEINPASILQQIEHFQETRAQRAKLGTQVQLLQSSAIWDEEDEGAGLRIGAGLVDRLNAPSGEHDGSNQADCHRYALELPARQALASGRRQVIVVQNLSLLRVSDSRLIDSWAIIWVVKTSTQEQPRLELVPISEIPDASQREPSRLRPRSPVESETFSSPELTPSPILPTTSILESAPLSHSSLSQHSDYAPKVNTPEGSPSASSPMETAPLGHEETSHAGPLFTPLSLTLPPIMTQLVDDSPVYVPMRVEGVHDDFAEEVRMRSRLSQSQARFEASEHITTEYPGMRQEHPIPSIVHNYTTPPQMPSPPPPPIISYPVIQHPIPRNHHSYQPTHTISPVASRDDAGPVHNIHPPFPVHYPRALQNTSHLIPDEWHHAGHDHQVQGEVDPRYEAPSSYHPVYVQHVRTPPHHEPQFMYVEEVVQEPISSPASAGSTSSQAQFHMAHQHPLVEQSWYPVGSPVRGVSPGPYPYRRSSEASIWGIDSYPSTRASFSSSGRGASVPPVNGMEMQHSNFHPGPVQYVFVDDAYTANEVMAPNAYISDDTSGYRFPASLERPRSQHHSYHLQHPHVMPSGDPTIYGGYQY